MSNSIDNILAKPIAAVESDLKVLLEEIRQREFPSSAGIFSSLTMFNGGIAGVKMEIPNTPPENRPSRYVCLMVDGNGAITRRNS